MIFVGMAEDAIVFIEAEAAHDAKAFAHIDLVATDERPVLVYRIADDPRLIPDVVLRWVGHDAGAHAGRHLTVQRAGSSKSRTLDADRAWYDKRVRLEKRPLWDVTHSTPTPDPALVELSPAWRFNLDEITAPPPNVVRALSPMVGQMMSLVPTNEHTALLDNLMATHVRCNSLLAETRFARRERDAWHEAFLRLSGISDLPMRLVGAVQAIVAERGRQDAKWGPIAAPDAPQNALAIPFGTGGETYRQLADDARASCDAAFDAGDGTWADVLKEELAEVLAETDPSKLRVELVQLGAMCMKLVEILDWRSHARPAG